MAAIIPIKKPYITVGFSQSDYLVTTSDVRTGLQQALDYANAAGGALIRLKKGSGSYNMPSGTTPLIIYSGTTLILDDGTEIIGHNNEYSNNSTSVGVITTPAPGSGTGVSTAKGTYNNIQIIGGKVKALNGGYSITLFNATHSRVRHLEAYSTGTTLIKAGIYLRYGDDAQVEDCYVHDTNGNGININAIDNFQVFNNKTKSTRDDGIDIDYNFGDDNDSPSRYGKVFGNTIDTITHEGNGIRIENSHYVDVFANTIKTGTPTNAGDGIWIGCDDRVTGLTTSNINVFGNTIRDCKTVGIHTEIVSNVANTVENIQIFGNNIKNCGENSGTDVRGGIVHAAAVTSGKKVKIWGNNIDTVSKTTDSGGIVIYKQGRVEVKNNTIVNAPYGIHLWNGNNATTYTDVTIKDNKPVGTSADYFGENDSFLQSGVIFHKSSTATASYEVSRKDATSTTQGYFKGFNPAWPNAWAGWEIKTAGGGDQTDLIGYTGYGTAGEAIKFLAETKRAEFNTDTIRVKTSRTPASASASGNQGDIAWDSTYLYICTATNTWRRIAHSTW